MLFLQGKSLKRNDQCTIGQDYIYYHILIYKDNCSMNPYTFGSFFPALAARIRVNFKGLKGTQKAKNPIFFAIIF